MKIIAVISVVALVAGACAVDEDTDLAAEEHEITGLRWRGGVDPSGLMQIRKASTTSTYPSIHTGLVVAKDSASGYLLVLTSEQVVNAQTTPSSVSVYHHPSGSSPSRPGRHVNSSDFFPGAVIQTRDFEPQLAPLDTRSSSALVGRSLRCFEYSNPTTLQYVDIRVSGYDGDTLTARYTPSQEYNVPQLLDAWDDGAMCRDNITGAFVAFVKHATTIDVTLHRIGGLSTWLGQMQTLARIRSHGSNARIALYNTLSSPMCLDIPWASPFPGEPMNQYPCHYGTAQRFWLDYSLDSNHPRLVSDASGLCADVPSASSATGINLQQYPCHTGTNQRFEMTLWGDSAGGWKLRPLSGTSANLCLAVEGGASPSAAPLEQRSCGGSWDQRWFLSWL